MQQLMKPFVLIAAAALLLAGCQSKRDTCAWWGARQMSDQEAVKALGLKPAGRIDDEINVRVFCRYYKS